VRRWSPEIEACSRPRAAATASMIREILRPSAGRASGKRRLFDALARIRSHADLLAPAGRGAARLLVDRIKAAPGRVYVGAALSALVLGISGNALLLQIGRHPAPLFAPAAQDAPPAPSGAAAEAAAPHAFPAIPSPDDAAATPAAAAALGASLAPAPDTTSSIPHATHDEQHPSSGAPAASADQNEPRAAARVPDQIGALLRGNPIGDGSRLVRSAQIALAKLGYPVKADGAEDGATRRALRDFERAHGLVLTTEINPALVKQLSAATRAER